MEGFDFAVQSDDGERLVIEVQGTITPETAIQLREKFLEVLEDKPQHVDIDLSNVTYIASAGIGAFVSFLRRLKEEGGTLKLFGL